ncbi:MAG: hypothetical protein VYD18_08720 [Candidatus Latescibacterota bacterium]|nr:hypothetical protein [Candidatus Latescibacterota bacterium]
MEDSTASSGRARQAGHLAEGRPGQDLADDFTGVVLHVQLSRDQHQHVDAGVPRSP